MRRREQCKWRSRNDPGMYRAVLYFSDASRPSAAGPLLGAASSSGDELPTACRQRRGDEPDGAIAVRHALHRGRTDLRLLRATDVRCERSGVSGEAKPTRALAAKVPRRFRVTLDAKRSQWPFRPPPLHPATHGLRLCVTLARTTESNRACSRRRGSQAPFAMCGRLRVGKSFLHVCSIGRCSHVFGLGCGSHDRWP